MKRILTTIIVALSVLSASAQFGQSFGQSVLNLRLSDNAPFKVFIDGRETGVIGNAAKVDNLPGGRHLLQISRVRNMWGQTSLINVFNDYIVLTPYAESWVTVYPEVRKVKFDDIRAFKGKGFKHHDPDHRHHLVPVVDPCVVETEPHYLPAPVGPFAMNPNDFGLLKQTLNNADFESTRLTIFKQALSYNYFTTGQVRELMSMFWFEGSKLEVAKLAYPKTVDQNNYYLVNNEFSFSSSVNELGNYIAMR